MFIDFYLLAKIWKLSDLKNCNISKYASNLHIERLKEFQIYFSYQKILQKS